MSELIDRVAGLLREGQNAALSGMDGACRAFFLIELAEKTGQGLIYITAEEEDAYDAARHLRGFVNPERVLVLPGRDYLAELEGTPGRAGMERAAVLGRLSRGESRSGVVITSVPALMFSTLPVRHFRDQSFELRPGEALKVESFLRGLVNMGYIRQPVVENPGQFTVRGGIIDVFPAGSREPVRIELFGNEIDSLRSFSPQTQRSTGALKSVSVRPARETAQGEGRAWDYFPPHAVLVVEDLAKIRDSWALHTRRYRNFLQQASRREGQETLKTVPYEDFIGFLNNRNALYHAFFPQTSLPVPVALSEHVAQRESEPFWARPELLGEKVREWQEKKWQVLWAVPEKAGQESLQKELERQGIKGPLEFRRWKLEKGFESATLKTAVVAERDIAGRRAGKVQPRKRGPRIQVDELAVGDYVVHENHGIGIFRGVTHMEIDGVRREYVLIQYAGTDRLYLPLDRLDLLSRYSGGDGREPRLSKLGGSDWEKTKKRVKESIQELARELLELYAAREKVEGFAFAPDTVWQKQFEEAFEFEETPDQARAVAEVKRDMEKPRPMDRLICGDVGYGKTEVAMRAAFKALMDQKQVAVLVPTTVLAEQHYNTFKNRFASYPVVIEALSRFRTPAQQKRILEDLRRGTVDIIIGTHRLLSRDVQFKDLGLLIIDEEHRFGVRQKEKIKALRTSVDVISLSATPIPRTLHMALTGLRDLSVIETPPPERYPINTYVMEYNPDIIREAVLAEIERGGQVFYVHNRINDIEKVRAELQELLPEVKIDVAHGRMNEEELSRVMSRFVSGQSDLLLCTTIIESGLDMPNVNTLIVDEADRMGLAQLYQLRGRVGRSRRVAYAYLTYRPDRVITEAAQKRLNAIREFTELGSGMKIALRDLEIRGAGNILGPEQHGYIEAVGFDLYCRLLEEETARSRGEVRMRREAPQLDVRVDSYIPDDYIDDPTVKLQIYRQVMLAERLEEVDEIEQEMADRFGAPPEPVLNLLRISRLRLLARDKDIRSISTDQRSIELSLAGPLGSKARELARLREKYGFEISVTNQSTLVLKGFKSLPLDALQDLLEVI